MSRVLYAFDISPPLDELGRPIVVEPQSKNGALSCVSLVCFSQRFSFSFNV